MADPQIAAILAEAQEGVCVEVARLVGLLGPAEADPADTARRLLALSDGLTQAVFLGHLPAAQAEDLVDAELARLTRADPANIAYRGRRRPGTDEACTVEQIIDSAPGRLTT